jgi:hypothetical protein
LALLSGTVDIGEDLTMVCAVPENGVRIRNLGDVTVWVGGEDITAAPDGPGFPVEAGQSETFPGATVHESPVVPAPPDDMASPQLYARTAAGTGTSKVTWLAAG